MLAEIIVLTTLPRRADKIDTYVCDMGEAK